ncbi:MAG TPA: hypothetical protein VJT31_21205 [Rugosimonospora sp.]|nr:hypothetical protein [Rugosimonospora sp.]
MRSLLADEESRHSLWLRVRRFAVPPSMIESVATRRRVGDWAGACAAAHVDVDMDLRRAARAFGRELAARVRDDLRHLIPDLLRWHLPRIAPAGLMRPGLTMSLATYGHVHLVVRTPPAWADGGQRTSLALWEPVGCRDGPGIHPHPHPDRRYRLDLHRHLWDARHTHELGARSGARPVPGGSPLGGAECLPVGIGAAVDRWTAEAGILLRAEGRDAGRVAVRLGSRRMLLLHVDASAGGAAIVGPARPRVARTLPVLPDAATWVLPDLELLRAGLIDPGELHPLVAAALTPGHLRPARRQPERPGLVECRGAWHRIGLVDGVLVPLDHDPVQLRRESLLAALSGSPLPCLRFIDEAYRCPEDLDDIRARLDHGDTAGALSTVEELLGPDVPLCDGPLRDAVDAAAQRRIVYALFRAGLAGSRPGPTAGTPRRTGTRRRTRHATHTPATKR